MNNRRRLAATLLSGALCALTFASRCAAADVPLGGFIPFVGIGLTRQFETFEDDLLHFIADPSYSWSGTPLGSGGPYFDLALLDTGATTHIITQSAASSSKFGVNQPFSGEPDGFNGTHEQTVYGATGPVILDIKDPLGIYAAGLGDRTGAGATLMMNTTPNGPLRGQTNFALLEAPSTWTLPNILGLPMAAQHAIVIRNSDPQIFQHQGNTVRTPQIEFIDLGTGGEQGILRRTNLRLRPSSSFLTGPIYVAGFDFDGEGELVFHENPNSPTIMENGGIYVEVDVANAGQSVQDKEILFDTGADLTVFSEVFAASLGIDVVLDEPDFFLEVEGASGVVGGVPGYYVEELKIDAVGGAFVVQNVPVAVLDVPNPNDPANVIDAILGMHVFTGRDLVIDAIPAATGGGASPRLYIGDPVSETHTWASSAPSGSWATGSNWAAPGAPGTLWDARLHNTISSDKTASVSANSTIYQMQVSASSTGRMIVDVLGGATLTTYGEARIDAGGMVVVEAAGRLDSQNVNIYGGTLAGEGTVFVGTGPVKGVVRNLSGRVAPGGLADTVGQLTITGDFSNADDGTLAIDLAGTALTQYDRLAVSRFAFLDGNLEVNLRGFTPSIGAMFTILTAEEVFGEFDSLLLPAAFEWDVTYNDDDVVLTVLSAGLAGDFNDDGSVDAADYVWWQKNGGTPQDYTAWRNNFATSSSDGGGASTPGGVPEPTTVLLLLIGAVIPAARRFS